MKNTSNKGVSGNVLRASAEAAMIPAERAAALSEDLGKIEVMIARAASSCSSEGDAGENSIVEQFADVIGTTGTKLRGDIPAASDGKDIISQSKRHAGEYTSVPRIV